MNAPAIKQPAGAVTTADALAIEAALVEGDLSRLTPEQRVTYYNRTCESLGLNPLTQPFAYIRLNGKLTLYAKKDCTDQIRSNRGVCIDALEPETIEGVFLVRAKGHDKSGRTDASTGAVAIQGLRGESLANAFMKAETKAKRRLTLSLCGLGMLDETEVADIREAQIDVVDVKTGEIKTAIASTPSALPGEFYYRIPPTGNFVKAQEWFEARGVKYVENLDAFVSAREFPEAEKYRIEKPEPKTVAVEVLFGDAIDEHGPENLAEPAPEKPAHWIDTPITVTSPVIDPITHRPAETRVEEKQEGQPKAKESNLERAKRRANEMKQGEQR